MYHAEHEVTVSIITERRSVGFVRDSRHLTGFRIFLSDSRYRSFVESRCSRLKVPTLVPKPGSPTVTQRNLIGQ